MSVFHILCTCVVVLQFYETGDHLEDLLGPNSEEGCHTQVPLKWDLNYHQVLG